MSLYNDVRPKTLREVQGQQNIKNQLSGLFATGKIPNAMLYTGPRGTGKTTIARIVAKMLNCTNGGEEPCNGCQSCKEIMNGTSMDVIELDAASNNKVEDVRTIIEKAQYKPLGKYKVFILDEVHMFSTGAWNALLKTIEEPPKNCVFILCTTEEHKVPATIISRAMKFYFEKLDLNIVADYLQQIAEERGKACEEDALKLIAQASEGCMRDALSILEPFLETDSLTTDVVACTLGMSQENSVFDILMAIQNGDSSTAIKVVRDVSKQGRSLQLLLKGLVSAISDAIFVANGVSIDTIVNTVVYKQRLSEYVSRYQQDLNIPRLLELSKQFSSVYGALTKTPDAEFLIETAVLGAIQCEAETDRLYAEIRECKKLLESGVPVVSAESVVSVETESAPVTDGAETDIIGQPVDETPIASDEDADIPFDWDHINPADYGFEPADSDVPFEMEGDEVLSFVPNEPTQAVDEVSKQTNDVTPLEAPMSNELPFDEDTFELPSAPKHVAPSAPVQNTPAKVEDVAPQATETTDAAALLLAHLPKGTKVSGNTNNIQTASPVQAKAVENTKTSDNDAGETQPLVKADNGLPPLGFDGFSGWL